ncbi:hypothetical protein Hanom_Chr15g01400411 [Helianthus anomalus]
MTASLRQRDEERMKKNVESLVDELKKVAEEEKDKEAVTEKQQNEEDQKNKEEVNEKLESLVEVDDGADAGGKQQEKETDQTQTEEKAEVPITEVNTLTGSEVINKIVEQCKKCMETCSAFTEKDENFRTRDLELTKIEEVFKNKCKEM